MLLILKSRDFHDKLTLKFLFNVVLVAQLFPILCDPTDCSPPVSSVHGILQARTLEWIAIPFSRGSSWPRDQTQVSCIASKLFTCNFNLNSFLSNSFLFFTVYPPAMTNTCWFPSHHAISFHWAFIHVFLLPEFPIYPILHLANLRSCWPPGSFSRLLL